MSHPATTPSPDRPAHPRAGEPPTARGSAPVADEIRPPAWAVSAARRLDLLEFTTEFGGLLPEVHRRIVKVEVWPTYQEPETGSLHAYMSGNHAVVRALLEIEAEQDSAAYDHVQQAGASFIRLRAVTLPLTPYLTYEMLNYTVRARLGETIEIADLTADRRPLPNPRSFDFLLFDRDAALIHDYGHDGLQVGGWLTRDPAVLARLARNAAALRRRTVPLDAFLAAQPGNRVDPWTGLDMAVHANGAGALQRSHRAPATPAATGSDHTISVADQPAGTAAAPADGPR
jgi:hypothetical protein